MSKVLRYYVEKPAKTIETDISEALELSGFTLRLFTRYDIQTREGCAFDAESLFAEERDGISGGVYKEQLPDFGVDVRLHCVEPVPGQFDALADACEQNIQLLTGEARPFVKTATVYAFAGLNDGDFDRAISYQVNPLEYCVADWDKPEKLVEKAASDSTEPIPEVELSKETVESLGLAMSEDDLAMVADYFKTEALDRCKKCGVCASDVAVTGRNPTLTEIRVLDTYWSDHCRHTTFNTIIKQAELDIKDERVQRAYDLFMSVNGEKPVTLMNIATAAMRHLKKQGLLPLLDESDEINACTLRLRSDDKSDDILLFFKNETHNHPTEIEPFGGASTCIGGAIRDPLSGRSYVYQGMRITGAGYSDQAVKDTLPGKLSQRKLIETAAEGFSSYANHIGVASSYAKELYHPGYTAKRMEAGAVVAAADAATVRRERPQKGDIVLLLGGRTGRDGVGGATGSSITHDADTVTRAACEVQKGNPPEERRIQRLFRKPEVTTLIKKCNDFGAGGVAVAVGELADGLEINLDAVPTKYKGLNGTEIAISESQERMAIVIAESDLQKMLEQCDIEGVEASVIAKVTEEPRLVMKWQGNVIVDLSREFLDKNGAKRYTSVSVSKPSKGIDFSPPKDAPLCVSRFDGSVGGLSVFMQYGGKNMSCESQVMAALIPGAKTKASVMAYGFNPYRTEADPFGGSAYAVVSSIAKIIAAGTDLDTVHLSFQEYFPRVTDQNGKDVPQRWGLPFAALLGAFEAQMGLKIAAIGGKDSMSGSFGDLDVPPTLISFAIGTGDAKTLVSPEFKGGSTPNPVYIINTPIDDYAKLRIAWEKYGELVRSGKVLAAAMVEDTLESCIENMSRGNDVKLKTGAKIDNCLCAIVFEASEELEGYELLGYTDGASPDYKLSTVSISKPASVNCVIPILPGTTGEWDTATALERAGCTAEPILIRNLTPAMLNQSVAALEKSLSCAKMLVLPGGVYSADLMVSLFRNPKLADSVKGLLSRNGLVLGVGDGFKALLKLGLLDCQWSVADYPTHIHKYVPVKQGGAKSPWLLKCDPAETYVQPISHSQQFNFINLPDSQVAFRYADSGAIEAVTSVDGKVLGKMGHFERYNDFTAKNIPGEKFLPLFEGAVEYLNKS